MLKDMGRLAVILVLLVVGILLSYITLSNTQSSPGKMNVVLISIDSLRADHMSLYGYSRNTTPNIDAWAKKGVVFENYFSTSYLTPISEMSVHTGRYPFTNGMVNFMSPLRGDTRTLAEILNEKGWETATFGSSPEIQWFPSVRAGFYRGFNIFPMAISGIDTVHRDRFTARGGNPVKDAVDWLRKGKKSDTPFFLWLPIGSVHWPYGQDFPMRFTDHAYNGFLKNATSGWQTYSFIFNGKTYQASTIVEIVKGLQSYNYITDIPPIVSGIVLDEDIRYLNARYDDGIAYTDLQLKFFLDYLVSSGLAANTIVVIESEHGEGLGEHGYIAHYDILDTQVHTPLIIHIPGVPARRVQDMVSGVDILPTVLSALAVKLPKVDGVDFLPYLNGTSTTSPRSEVFISRTPLWESVLSYAFGSLGRKFREEDDKTHYYDTAVRNQEWKLIHRLSRGAQLKYSWWGWVTGTPVKLPEYELYNIKSDPLERENLYTEMSEKNNPDIIKLKGKLNLWEEKMKEAMPGPTPKAEIKEYF